MHQGCRLSRYDLLHVTDVCERIVVLEKGELVKDLVTSEATLKELEAHFTN
jgi:ABC-2 type transport system ATP-binding protein